MRDRLLVFISYAHADGTDLMNQVYGRLKASDRYDPWADRHDGAVHDRFETDIEQILAGADAVIFILTRASAHPESWSRDELKLHRDLRARGGRTGLIVLRVHAGVMAPLPATRWTEIDFTADTTAAWADLDARLSRIASPDFADDIDAQGGVDARLAAVDQGLEDASEQENIRAEDPTDAPRQVAAEIERAQELERVEPAASGAGPVRFVNEIPSFPPVAFQDRLPQLERLEHGLGRPEIGLVVVTGPDGIGKTEMMRHLRDRLAGPRPAVTIQGFVYLSAYGHRLITPALLLDDLARAAPDSAANLAELLADPLPWPEKVDRVARAFGGAGAVIVIDHGDDLIDPQGRLQDRELGEVVEKLVVGRPDHGIRLVLVARRAPEALVRDLRGQAMRVALDDGLPRDYAELFVRALAEGAPGSAFDGASRAQLDRLYEVTSGHPRALELAFGLASREPYASPDWLLGLLAGSRSADAADTLFRELFDRLQRGERRVVQALAVYGRPVLPDAVDYLLAELLPGRPSRPVLQSLHQLRLVRRDGDRYYIPPTPDGHVVLTGIPRGTSDDRGRSPMPLSRMALLCRAANYFEMIRPNDDRVERVEHLDPHFTEIELRLRGEQYRAAFELMNDLDDKYLARWGHSDALVRWRRDLRGNLGERRDEAVNRSYLVAAHGRYDDQIEVQHELRRALREVGRLGHVAMEDRLALHLQLAASDFDDDQLNSAGRRFRGVIAGCALLGALTRAGVRGCRAEALSSLGVTLSRTGQFSAGLALYRRAERIARGLPEPERSAVESLRLLNEGWTLGQIGDREAALPVIRKARELTRSAGAVGGVLDEGRCLDAEAAVLLDWGEAELAVSLAAQAVEIGAMARNSELSREANVSLALAYLALDDLDRAAAAADAAAYYHQSTRALGALGLQGLTAFRLGHTTKARQAFQEACSHASERQRREPRAYLVLDAYGLALCGYALCVPSESMSAAVDTYRRARAITTEGGVVRRATLLLDHLGAEVNPNRLADVRTAATRAPSRRARGR